MMKNIITKYNLYNESLKNKLKGKSDDEVIDKLKNYTPHGQFIMACEHGITSLVKKLLKDGINPATNNNHGIRLACRFGHTEIVRELLKDDRINPGVMNDYCIGRASRYGYMEIVKMLMKNDRVNPADDNNGAVWSAVIHNNIDVVKELLKDDRVDPTIDDNNLLKHAMSNGYLEIVKELIRFYPYTIKEILRPMATPYYDDIIKLIEDYKSVNESLRDKIKGKSMDEIIEKLKDIKKWDTRLLLNMYQKIKGIDNRELLHFLSEHDAFTVCWYSLENVLDDELGEDGYDELYDMSIDDQIDFIESNSRFDQESLIDISIDIIERNDETFENIKKIILKEISK